MYFGIVPDIQYRFGSDNIKIVQNFFIRVKKRADDKLHRYSAYYDNYTLQQGERAEDVADKIYGNSQYHWVVLIVNNAINGTTRWFKSDKTLDKIIERKYGDKKTLIKYDNITYEEHERLENDKMRDLYVLSPQYLGDFVKYFKELVK